MATAAQQRWLLRGAVALAVVGAASATHLLMSEHLELPLRAAAEAWLATGNLTSDLLASASGGMAGCVGSPRGALRLPEASRVGPVWLTRAAPCSPQRPARRRRRRAAGARRAPDDRGGASPRLAAPRKRRYPQRSPGAVFGGSPDARAAPRLLAAVTRARSGCCRRCAVCRRDRPARWRRQDEQRRGTLFALRRCALARRAVGPLHLRSRPLCSSPPARGVAPRVAACVAR